MSKVRTDLAAEWVEKEPPFPDGVTKEEKTLWGVLREEVVISTEKAAQFLNKPMGRYSVLHVSPLGKPSKHLSSEIKAVAETLAPLLPKGSCLAVGLGNDRITPDALGPKTAKRILVTRHLKREETGIFHNFREVVALSPGVLGETGLEASETAAAVTNLLSPEAVVVIDALAARERDHLGCTIQIGNSGIYPGSGVANHRKGLTKETLGVPVIAVGVPTVAGLRDEKDEMMVTPREIDTIIENASKIIAAGINVAFQPSLSVDDVLSLME